jgi:hypothetical protein
VLLNVVIEPTQTVVVPVIVAGNGSTVTVAVALQPVESVYVIVAAPADTPVTTPVVKPTLAVLGLLLLHVPPVEVLLREIVEPAHTFVGPVMPDGSAFTVIFLVL